MPMLHREEQRRLDLGLGLLRLGLGLTFLFFHGGPKLFGGPERWARVGSVMQIFGIDFAPTFWGLMAALSEFVGGGILLILGLFWPWALVPVLATLLVAALGHFMGAIPGSPLYPLEIALIFLALIFTGPGRYSLDAWRNRK
jgi:putative oxidoreductase